MKFNAKSIVLAGALLGASFVGAGQASAMPVAPVAGVTVQGAHVVQAGWRCGPGWHMNGWGRCVPNRWRRW